MDDNEKGIEIIDATDAFKGTPIAIDVARNDEFSGVGTTATYYVGLQIGNVGLDVDPRSLTLTELHNLLCSLQFPIHIAVSDHGEIGELIINTIEEFPREDVLFKDNIWFLKWSVQR